MGLLWKNKLRVKECYFQQGSYFKLLDVMNYKTEIIMNNKKRHGFSE
jgi:hypothetical protein